MSKKWNLPQDYRKLSQQERREVRLQYMDEQNADCAYCEKCLYEEPVMDKPINWNLFPGGKDFLRYPVHLHHNHKTGMTIGAVHAYCNAVSWQYDGE